MTISKELLDELLSGFERPEDFFGDKGLMKELKVRQMERILGAELTEHLGYEPHGEPGNNQANRRNGATRKVLKGNDSAVPIDIPRDRPSHQNCVSTAGQWTAVLNRS
jgi:putative transposase